MFCFQILKKASEKTALLTNHAVLFESIDKDHHHLTMLRRTAKSFADTRLLRSLSLGALSFSAISVGVSTVALYVDAPVADMGDGKYDGGRRTEVFPEWLHNVARVPLFAAVTLGSKFFLSVMNQTKVEGVELLIQQLEQRPKGTAVITVSNHSATVDDPAVFAK